MLLNTNGRTVKDFSNCWEILSREEEQSAIYLNTTLTGALATGPAIVEQSEPGQSCRQMLTKQREELKEVLVRHQNAFARPVRAYHEFDGLESLTPWRHKRPH